MKHINRGPFISFPVALPPLGEQARIVAKVDELLALCQELELAHDEERRAASTIVEMLGATGLRV